MEIDFATIPAAELAPGHHVCDSRIPMDNKLTSVRVLDDGTVIAVARERDRRTQRTAVDYTGAGHVLRFRPNTLTEVWYNC